MSKPTQRDTKDTVQPKELRRREASKAKRKTASQLELRNKLKVGAYLHQLEKAAKVYLEVDQIAAESIENKAPLCKATLSALELRLKATNGVVALNLRRIAKVLPDVQAIAIMQEKPDSPLTSLMQAIDEHSKSIIDVKPLTENDDNVLTPDGEKG